MIHLKTWVSLLFKISTKFLLSTVLSNLSASPQFLKDTSDSTSATFLSTLKQNPVEPADEHCFADTLTLAHGDPFSTSELQN